MATDIRSFMSYTPNRQTKRKVEGDDDTPSKRHQSKDPITSQAGLNMFHNLEETEAPSKDPTQNPRHQMMPPIIIGQEIKNPRDTLAKIKSWAPNLKFKVIRGQHAILTRNDNDFKLIQEKLKSSGIESFTFTPNSEKHKKLILKGLDTSVYTIEEIKDDLKAQNQNIINVTQLKSLRKNDPKTVNVFLVTLKWDTNVQHVKKQISDCKSYLIRWEDYRKPKQFRGVQCFACQRYGHVSTRCYMKPRCVKCTETHLPGQCKKGPDVKPTCVNCGEEHPASYRGCSKAKEYIQTITPPNRSAENVNNGREPEKERTTTYSGAVQGWAKTNIHHQNSTQPNGNLQFEKNDFAKFNSEMTRLFNMNFLDMFRKVSTFWATYKTYDTDDQRSQAMFNFMLSLTNNSK